MSTCGYKRGCTDDKDGLAGEGFLARSAAVGKVEPRGDGGLHGASPFVLEALGIDDGVRSLASRICLRHKKNNKVNGLRAAYSISVGDLLDLEVCRVQNFPPLRAVGGSGGQFARETV